jgi:MOSC domain-containing protein YiiM
MTTGRIVQLSVSAGGVPKLAVPTARVGPLGLEGDSQRDHEHHGGPERAVCLFAMEQIAELRAEGHPIMPGAIGENVTVEGLDWAAIVPGVRLGLGDEVVVQVTRYTSPCVNIKAVFRGGDFARVSQKVHPGSSRVYASVVTSGVLRAGDPVRVLSDSSTERSPANRR